MFVGLLLFFPSFWDSGNEKSTSNVTIKNGIQYITIDAKGGYKPETTLAKWGIPTKLIMNTKNTYDCSAAVVVPSVNYREILPENALTEIDLGTPKVGEKIPGNCSMGMYHFSVIFN